MKQSNACSCQKLDPKHAFSVIATIPVPLKGLPQVRFAEIVDSVLFGNKGVFFITVEKFKAANGDGWILLAIETTAVGKWEHDGQYGHHAQNFITISLHTYRKLWYFYFDWQMEGQTDRQTNRQTGTEWLNDWLTGWPTDWLIVNWLLTDWPTDPLTHWRNDAVTHRPTKPRTHWPIEPLTH